ncbi:MAG: TetR family transcriptional regulator [Schumannella sp.]
MEGVTACPRIPRRPVPRIPASERRAALARAALTVIARDGLAAATTRAIVAEAGMPLASFHYAVASRDELLRDVIELVVAAEGVAAGGLLAQAETPRDAIRGALNGYLDHVRSDPGAEQAMFELTQYALRTPEARRPPGRAVPPLPRTRRRPAGGRRILPEHRMEHSRARPRPAHGDPHRRPHARLARRPR